MSEGGRDGGCRCGQVRFRVSGAPKVTMACHYRGCQQMTASAFLLSALYVAQLAACDAARRLAVEAYDAQVTMAPAR